MFIYLLLREKERECTAGEGQREREGGTESEAGSRLWAVSRQPDAGLQNINRHHDLSQSWTLNWLRHLGAPCMQLLILGLWVEPHVGHRVYLKKKKKKKKKRLKTLTDTSPKKIYKWQINIGKDALHHISGKCKLKQWHITTYPLERPESGTLTTPKAGKDVDPQEPSYIASGNANDTVTSEESLMISYKTKHTLTIWSSNYAPWYLPKGVENFV